MPQRTHLAYFKQAQEVRLPNGRNYCRTSLFEEASRLCLSSVIEAKIVVRNLADRQLLRGFERTFWRYVTPDFHEI